MEDHITMSANIQSGLVLAGFDTFVTNFKNLVSDTFIDTGRYYHNKYVDDLQPPLICYGAEIVKNSMATKGAALHKSACDKILGIYRNYNNNNRPFFIDSGGFQICRGKVSPEYVDILSEYYTQFIQDTSSDPTYDNLLYLYLDVIPTNGITPDFAIRKMLEFQSLLMDRTKDTKGYEKVFLVLHCNAKSSYDTFYKFIRNHSIHEQLNSHKYAVGGMVPLNFNQSSYLVRPYMVAIFDMIDLELSNIKNNIPVYFHILGTSSLYEMICISWLNVLLHYYELPLTITFDSTTHIGNSTRQGIMHYINDYSNSIDIYPITCFLSKYNTIYKNAYNRPIELDNYYYFNRVRDDILSNLDVRDPNDMWFDSGNNHRWTQQGIVGMNVYETWSFGKVFQYIRDVSEQKRDWIVFKEKRCYLKQLIYEILSILDSDFVFNGGRKAFDSRICGRIIQSLDWFDLAIHNKLPNRCKGYHLVNGMFHDNDFLMTTPMIKFNNTMISNEEDRKVLLEQKKLHKKQSVGNGSVNNGSNQLRRFDFTITKKKEHGK